MLGLNARLVLVVNMLSSGVFRSLACVLCFLELFVSAGAATANEAAYAAAVAANAKAFQSDPNAVIESATVLGVGSSLASIMYEQAMITYMFLKKPNAVLSYTNVNSEVGACRIKVRHSLQSRLTSMTFYSDVFGSMLLLVKHTIDVIRCACVCSQLCVV